YGTESADGSIVTVNADGTVTIRVVLDVATDVVTLWKQTESGYELQAQGVKYGEVAGNPVSNDPDEKAAIAGLTYSRITYVGEGADGEPMYQEEKVLLSESTYIRFANVSVEDLTNFYIRF